MGAGRMGGAMAQRWLAQGLPKERLLVCDPAPSQMIRAWAADKEVKLVATPQGAKPACIVLAIKPQHMGEVLPTLAGLLDARPVILSIAAGVKLAAILEGLGAPDLPAARAMPNFPALVGKGISAVWGNAALDEAKRRDSESLLSVLGRVCWLKEESELDAATAISGSGPAYFFYLVEALTEAAVDLGLDRQLGRQLAQETAIGAGALLAQEGADAKTLCGQITSPGGTTEAALNLLMPELEKLMKRAAQAAAARAAALGREQN